MLSLRSMPPTETGDQFLLVRKDVTEQKTTEQRLRDSRELLRMLASDLVLAEERERRRIANLLHDDVGHSLALAQIRLGKMVQENAHGLSHELDPVRDLIAEAIKTTRLLTSELSSPVLYELGLDAALGSIVDRLSAATGINFDIESDGELRPLSEDKTVLVFRSAKELLLNAAKHARAQNVTLSIRTLENQVQIRVTDDGHGFDVTETIRPGGNGIGHGLLAAAERIRSLGGTLEVDEEPTQGSSWLIVVPLGNDSGESQIAAPIRHDRPLP
ncbi:MAG: signal transduction histidine kinase [Myxococcota bacterium]|jgi:signal transduction histidine kinase